MASLITRSIYLISGVGLGAATIVPNMMTSDEGTPRAMCAATIGMSASSAFVLGGVAGMISNNPLFLLPGVLLQIGVFTVPAVLEKFGFIQSRDEYYKQQRRKDE